MLAKYDLTLMNHGKSPTFRGHNGKNSIIDLTICDKVTANFIDGWHVSNNYTPSDHQPIKFQIKTYREKIFKNPTGWHYTTANWQKFEELVESSLAHFSTPPVWTYGILESKFKRIYKAINDALKLTCAPNKLSVGISQRPIWWNESVSRARAKVRLLTKKEKEIPHFWP